MEIIKCSCGAILNYDTINGYCDFCNQFERMCLNCEKYVLTAYLKDELCWECYSICRSTPKQIELKLEHGEMDLFKKIAGINNIEIKFLDKIPKKAKKKLINDLKLFTGNIEAKKKKIIIKTNQETAEKIRVFLKSYIIDKELDMIFNIT
jgi:hypothetical protein